LMAIQRDDQPGAIVELEGLLRMNPQYIPARLHLVDLYLATGQTRQLQRLLEESATLFPQEDAWPRIQAQIAQRQNNPADAIRHHQRALEMNPSPQNIGNLALALLEADRAGEVLPLLDQ